MHAYEFLKKAVSEMEDRKTQRDTPSEGKNGRGERSMKSTVEAFRGLTGHDLTEGDGWVFMILLKLVRGRQGAFREDDYTDAAAYSALYGEWASENQKEEKKVTEIKKEDIPPNRVAQEQKFGAVFSDIGVTMETSMLSSFKNISSPRFTAAAPGYVDMGVKYPDTMAHSIRTSLSNENTNQIGSASGACATSSQESGNWWEPYRTPSNTASGS